MDLKLTTDEQLEREILEKGLTAPRVSLGQLKKKVLLEEYYVFPNSQVTVCCLTLANGFTVIGESACASPENFDAALGREIALRKAFDKIWPLEGYLLKEKLYRERNP